MEIIKEKKKNKGKYFGWHVETKETMKIQEFDYRLLPDFLTHFKLFQFIEIVVRLYQSMYYYTLNSIDVANIETASEDIVNSKNTFSSVLFNFLTSLDFYFTSTAISQLIEYIH